MSAVTLKTDSAMLALLDVLQDIHDGKLTVTVGTADDIHRALRRLSEIGNQE
ncbi:hypothetical protein KZC51_06005 [Microbacterium sp. SSW1-49]|uniref:Uncharacterized protein n=1 Tax=Microbacterium croceum TaxID=2851645 RepID=A0ABT0FCB3_9MICO|nr:hypothetical protein [Microbacterium croceum]MCK2035685.1 hypothetical protein [Microbacterium croceum]